MTASHERRLLTLAGHNLAKCVYSHVTVCSGVQRLGCLRSTFAQRAEESRMFALPLNANGESLSVHLVALQVRSRHLNLARAFLVSEGERRRLVPRVD